MTEEITVTRDELYRAFHRWELDNRMGRCLPAEQCAGQSVEKAAEGCVDALLMHLREPHAYAPA